MREELLLSAERGSCFRRRLRTAAAAWLAVAMVVTTPLSPGAQTAGGGNNGGNTGGGTTTDSGRPRLGLQIPGPTRLTPYITSSIVQNIQAVRIECGRYDPIYRIECLHLGFSLVAQRIPQSGDYREMKAILNRAASELSRIVSANVDQAAPRQASRGNSRFKVRRTYRAVKKQKLKAALDQAEDAVIRAETRLLRSGENSQKRYQHYQQVATAVGSTKVLLRSS